MSSYQRKTAEHEDLVIGGLTKFPSLDVLIARLLRRPDVAIFQPYSAPVTLMGL